MNLSDENASDHGDCVEVAYCDCAGHVYVGLLLYHSTAALNIVLSLPIQLLLTWQLCHRDWSASPMHFLQLNACGLEVAFCLECLLILLDSYVFQHEALQKTVGMLYGLTWVGRPLFHTCICLEMYTAVIFPTKYRKYRAVSLRLPVVSVVWTVGFSYGAYVIWVRYDEKDILMLGLVSCCVAMVFFFCTSILRAIRRPGPGKGQRPGQDFQKQKAFAAISKLLFILLLMYTPLVVMAFLGQSGFDKVQFYCNLNPGLCGLYLLVVSLMSLDALRKEGNLPSCLRFMSS